MLRDISPARIFARPTAEDLWLGPTRESVLSHLATPGETRVLLGPAASGRTTLLRQITHRMGSQVTTLSASGPKNDGTAVLSDLLSSAGFESEGLAAGEMRRLVAVFIQEKLAQGQRVVIAIDDADGLGDAAWKEVEAIHSMSRNGHCAELLMGLVHLEPSSSPAASFVRGREAPLLGVLDWLRPREVSSYLHWRLNRFGLAEINTPAATRLIAHFTRGCFTTIDHISQIALLLLRNGSGEEIDVNVVCDAIRRLHRPQQSNGQAQTAKLIVTEDGRVIGTSQLKDRMLIGRSRSNDLCLDSHYVSRHHAALVREDGGYCFSDLNSVNGVLVNGTPVRQARITNGDVLAIGPFRLKLSIGEELEVEPIEDPASSTLADTAVMPAPEDPEPALRIIR